MSTGQEVSSYFNEINKRFITDYKKNGLKKHCTFFLKFLEKQDLSSFSVLEIGCGIGGLLFEILRLGACNAIGI